MITKVGNLSTSLFVRAPVWCCTFKQCATSHIRIFNYNNNNGF